MKGLRGEIAAGGNSLLPWYSLERMNARNNMAEDNRIRFRAMVPWGNSLRTELTREAAETAALLGRQKQNLVREFSQAAQDLAAAGMGATGYGGVFGGALKIRRLAAGGGDDRPVGRGRHGRARRPRARPTGAGNPRLRRAVRRELRERQPADGLRR